MEEMMDYCEFCEIARGATSTALLYKDDKIAVFPDIDPSAFRHYLVVPRHHISTVNSLQRISKDYELVKHMLKVGEQLLHQDAPQSEEHRFGFHVPPFNSVYHLHLHCLALPFIERWREFKYLPSGPYPGFMEAKKCIEMIKPQNDGVQ